MRKLRFGKLDAWLAGGADREGGGDGPVLVLLHGFGAPGTDLTALWRQIDGPRGLRYVFLGAPLVLETEVPNDIAARAWWMIDIAELQQKAAEGRLDELTERVPVGLAEAREALLGACAAIEQELSVEGSRLVLGGFSQGAMLACDFALRDERPLAGLVLMSSTLICRTDWQLLAPRRAGLPVLQSHGRADPILPFELAEKQRELLRGAGLAVEFIAFNGGHGIPGGVMDSLGGFLNRTLGPSS
jgi:phospholipase/carboxylesterase